MNDLNNIYIPQKNLELNHNEILSKYNFFEIYKVIRNISQQIKWIKMLANVTSRSK